MPLKISQTAAKILRLIVRGGRKALRSPGESILIFRMAIWVSILSILVKLQPLPRALRFVAPKIDPEQSRPTLLQLSGEERSREQTERSLAQAIDLLLGTDLLVFKPVCWKRATILHRYLALNGIATRIVFGVRKEKDGAISGHAWLETGTGPVLEKTAPDYVVTYTFPSNDPFDLELGVLTTAKLRR